ncbi:hypothetical protein ABPG74_018729 [Tetrahymena malaccensis]
MEKEQIQSGNIFSNLSQLYEKNQRDNLILMIYQSIRNLIQNILQQKTHVHLQFCQYLIKFISEASYIQFDQQKLNKIFCKDFQQNQFIIIFHLNLRPNQLNIPT